MTQKHSSFNIGDKVRHKSLPLLPGEVEAVSQVHHWPGKGDVRKIYWRPPGGPPYCQWGWDFDLEEW